MITENFDSRTVANMEVALERASRLLKQMSEQHEYRRYIASKILRRAEDGDTTLEGLTAAGSAAARELQAAAKRNSRQTSVRSGHK